MKVAEATDLAQDTKNHGNVDFKQPLITPSKLKPEKERPTVMGETGSIKTPIMRNKVNHKLSSTFVKVRENQGPNDSPLLAQDGS